MTIKETIQKAYADKFALGGFNVYNLESAKAVVEAANKKEEPVFLMMSEKSLDYAGFDELVDLAKNLRARSKTPVFLHLDHGGSLDIVKKCIKSGFDSVMFDGSKLPLDQNIQLSKDLRQIAHRNRVFFEAEIGHIGGAEDYVSSANFKTNPAEALMFYSEVKPDMLAIAIGNVHGYNVRDEQLDFTLLAKLQDTIKAPLVLHGCSNRGKREYQVAIAEGVVKVNIDTELRQAFVEGLHLGLRRRLKDPREILAFVSRGISKCVEEKIEIFSCSKLKC